MLCELEPKAETQKNQGAGVLVSASSIGCADWASTQPAGKACFDNSFTCPDVSTWRLTTIVARLVTLDMKN